MSVHSSPASSPSLKPVNRVSVIATLYFICFPGNSTRFLKGYEPKEKPDDRFYEDINSIRKIGNILNQIARRMHALGYVDDEKYLRKTVQNFNDFILDVKRKYLLPEKK